MSKLYNLRFFTYKRKKYVVSEIDINTVAFTGCCSKKYGIIGCVINHDLKPIEKQNTLHRLINGKNLRRG